MLNYLINENFPSQIPHHLVNIDLGSPAFIPEPNRFYMRIKHLKLPPPVFADVIVSDLTSVIHCIRPVDVRLHQGKNCINIASIEGFVSGRKKFAVGSHHDHLLPYSLARSAPEATTHRVTLQSTRLACNRFSAYSLQHFTVCAPFLPLGCFRPLRIDPLRGRPMARLAKFVLPDGSSIVAEVDDESFESSRVMRGGAGTMPELVIKANDSFETALDRIRTAAESMLNRLTSLAQPPDQLAIEFGVKLNAETGAVIAKAATEANFKINLTWSRPKAPPGSGEKE